MTNPFETTIKMETVKDEEGNDKVVWDYAKPGSEWARVDKDLNLVHLDMDLCAQGPANVYTALAIGVWNAATKVEREACAQVVEEYPHWLGMTAKAEIANAIRNRGNTRNERLEREATSIEDFKHRLANAIDAMPFGDTAASFAVFIRNFK